MAVDGVGEKDRWRGLVELKLTGKQSGWLCRMVEALWVQAIGERWATELELLRDGACGENGYGGGVRLLSAQMEWEREWNSRAALKRGSGACVRVLAAR